MLTTKKTLFFPLQKSFIGQGFPFRGGRLLSEVAGVLPEVRGRSSDRGLRALSEIPDGTRGTNSEGPKDY